VHLPVLKLLLLVVEILVQAKQGIDRKTEEARQAAVERMNEKMKRDGSKPLPRRGDVRGHQSMLVFYVELDEFITINDWDDGRGCMQY
jgi:hypothetical protein